MKIAYRSLFCFGIIAIILTGLGLFGLSQMSHIQSQSRKVELNSLPSIIESDNLALQMARVRIEALRLIALPGPETFQKTQQKIKDLSLLIEAGFKRYEPLTSSPEESQTLQRLQAIYRDYMTNVEQIKAFMLNGQVDNARKHVMGGMASLGLSMNEQTEKLRSLNLEAAKVYGEDAQAVYDNSVSITLTVIGCALALTILLAWRLTHSLSKPIRDAVQAAETIASGDLTHRLETAGTDEAAQLLKAIEKMQGNLRDTLEQINNSAEQLAAATEEMSAVMSESTQGLQQQNSEIEMAATAVTEMSQAVEEVAGNATSTSTASRAAAETARHGQRQLNDTLSAIGVLTDNVLSASEQARQLAEQTRNISQVLDVIRSVAEQTNLLALNAAIEAARAGDAGRGFAVVADEVRSLAHRTSESTREIEAMIGSIQQGTTHTVDALLTSADQARQTQEQAEAASHALGTINEAVNGIDERNLVIASAAEEQAQVAREVDRNLVRIRDLSVQTSAGAEQTHTASQELSRLAGNLSGMVRRFKV
ncbi:methyl-accepting chemotaxis protein [Pseudomonas asuensis]|uniref:Methyl-accepting chemotaxis protein n=1 Tax=Pseudomonas asuensis TaxID=1825787 RepID=A0ABQ2GXF5_9PSED|nr:methyl-accepting chemotaxis protein [Pseudomonas asuensis]